MSSRKVSKADGLITAKPCDTLETTNHDIWKGTMVMRTFIAVDFSDEVKKEILEIQRRLRENAVSGRWKYSGNFHLTLKFLGEVELRSIDKINRILDEICAVQKPFVLKPSQLGQFKGNGCCRVVWLGMEGETAALAKLQKSIDSELEKIGFEKEKRDYKPHVTIGQDVVFREGFEAIEKEAGLLSVSETSVKSLVLFKSEQIGRKRVYTPIREHMFRGGY